MPEGAAEWAGMVLLVAGGIGVSSRTVRFVRVTIQASFGSNPGFGAYEVTVLPWWLVACVGVGLGGSWRLAVGVFVVAAVGSGLLAQLLGSLFGRRR